MSVEIFAGYRLIRNTLTQDATMAAMIGDRVFPMPAPSGTVQPFVVVTFVSGVDLMVVANTRIWTNALWQVEVWSKTSDMAVIAQRVARLDALLHNLSGVLTGVSYGNGIVWSMRRERALFLPPEIDGDVVYMRGGGQYRQWITAA